jgi:hypothetical protein
MICFELFEQVVAADLPAFIDRMKKFGFQP